MLSDSTNELADLVRRTLEKIAAIDRTPAQDTVAQWTYSIKKEFAMLGLELGHRVCACGSGLPEVEPEWLFDMVWYRYNDPKEKILAALPFAMESEWHLSMDCIREDFEKLLVCKADLCLMICGAWKPQFERVLEYFDVSVKKFGHGPPGSLILVALYSYDREEFEYHRFIRPTWR